MSKNPEFHLELLFPAGKPCLLSSCEPKTFSWTAESEALTAVLQKTMVIVRYTSVIELC